MGLSLPPPHPYTVQPGDGLGLGGLGLDELEREAGAVGK